MWSMDLLVLLAVHYILANQCQCHNCCTINIISLTTITRTNCCLNRVMIFPTLCPWEHSWRSLLALCLCDQLPLETDSLNIPSWLITSLFFWSSHWLNLGSTIMANKHHANTFPKIWRAISFLSRIKVIWSFPFQYTSTISIQDIHSRINCLTPKA